MALASLSARAGPGRVLAWEHEGVEPARWLAARGYTAFLLKYRVRGTPPDPAEFAAVVGEIAAEDGRRAVEVVRRSATEWGVKADRLGMVGFSAGAFLAADVGMDPRAAPLAFLAPIYGGETGGRLVPADAPALFSAVAQDDRMMFRIVEGLYADWSSADRPAELHVFTHGGHGFGVAKRGLPVDRWSDLLGDWLADRGLG